MRADTLALMIPIIAILAGTFLAALKIWKGSSRTNTGSIEEAKLIQDIYHGLLKMEERVEALETLLLERDRDRKEV